MRIEDQEFVFQGLSVTYKFRRSLQDRRHLLVVFSGGFGPKRGYDLNGSVVDGIRTDILWIRDTFDGDFSYYIRTHRRGTLVAEAVAALIEKIRARTRPRKAPLHLLRDLQGRQRRPVPRAGKRLPEHHRGVSTRWGSAAETNGSGRTSSSK